MSTQFAERITTPTKFGTNGNGHGNGSGNGKVHHADPAVNVNLDEVQVVPVPKPPKTGFFKLAFVAVLVLAVFGGLFLSGWLPLTQREQALASEVQQRKAE